MEGINADKIEWHILQEKSIFSVAYESEKQDLDGQRQKMMVF